MNEWTLESSGITAVSGPVLLVVMDGVGLGKADEGNAFHLARTPVLDSLFDQHGCIPLAAHGQSVGLPSHKDMGNSEVGHNAIGAGRVFDQGASLVEKAIESGALFEGDTWNWLLEGVRQSGEALHFIGLLSDGNVHSHQAHLHQMLRMAARSGVTKARVHILLDGRDVGATTALEYVDALDAVLTEINASGHDFAVASGGGRMVVTMDRYEADWAMVERGWAHHVHGEGRRFPNARQAIETLREETGKTDQFLPPFVIGSDAGPVGPILDGASVCFFNFRGDRAIEISSAFEDDDFTAFDRGRKPNIRYAGMMQYDGDLKLPARYLVSPPSIDRTMGQYLAMNGIGQFACSETQKFGHVTYFWNGNRSGTFDDQCETYVEIPSDVIPFEQRPWMKAAEIVDATLQALGTGQFRHGRINLANGDMVGHTGDLESAILAMSSVDHALGRVLEGIKALNGVALVTADHGNCEEMFQKNAKTGAISMGEDGLPKVKTSHTTNPVPFSLYDPHGQVATPFRSELGEAGLGNLAATVFDLLGYRAPDDYLPSLLASR